VVGGGKVEVSSVVANPGIGHINKSSPATLGMGEISLQMLNQDHFKQTMQ
jgi:hypothetical protein